MTIQLTSDIDTTSRRPRTAIGFDTTSGVNASADRTVRVLLVGQRTSAGSVAAAVPTDLLRESDSATYFGPGSSLDLGGRAAFLADSSVRLSAVAVDDANGATAASQTITFANNAGADCAGTLRIGNRKVIFAVHSGDTPTVISTAARDAVLADPSLGVTASRNVGVLTLTWKQGGTVGNAVPISCTFSLPTATVLTTITLGAASLANGATDPDITAALAASAGARYHLVVVLLGDSTNGGAAKTHVGSQGGAEVGFGEVAIQAINAALSTATTLAAALNGPRNMVVSINGSASHPIEIASAFAAVMSGETDPARPLNTLALPGIAAPPVEKRWTKTEQDTLLAAGCSPLLVGPGDVVRIQRAVVTYTKNAQNIADYSQLDVTIVRSFDRIRDELTLMFTTRYGQSKWADDNPDSRLPADVATPAKVKADILEVLRACERGGICQNVDGLASQIDVQKVGTHCEFSVPTDIVDGLHEILGKAVLIRNPLS